MSIPPNQVRRPSAPTAPTSAKTRRPVCNPLISLLRRPSAPTLRRPRRPSCKPLKTLLRRPLRRPLFPLRSLKGPTGEFTPVSRFAHGFAADLSMIPDMAAGGEQ